MTHTVPAPKTPTQRRIARTGNPTDYSSPTYWASRFEKERAFEWLAGADTICPLVLQVTSEVRRASGGGDGAGQGQRGQQGEAGKGGEWEGRQGGVVSGAKVGDDGDEAEVAGPSRPRRPLRILHFGSGTSALGAQVQRYLQEAGEDVQVTDADYVADAIAPTSFPDADSTPYSTATAATPAVAARGVPLIDLDVLSLPQLLRQMPRSSAAYPPPSSTDSSADDCSDVREEEGEDGENGWDVLLDKSTADAISCGPDIPLSLSLSPASSSYVPSHGNDTPDDTDSPPDAPLVEPIIALCHNLARATRKGGRWLCISYSSTRFDHLSTLPRHSSGEGDKDGDDEGQQAGEPGWRLISKSPVDGFADTPPSNTQNVTGKQGAVVYAPQVNVWAYVLERI